MIPPVLFPLFTWLALLIRYPKRTLAIAVPVFTGILGIAIWVQWQEKSNEHLLNQLSIELAYSTTICPIDRPLAITVDNTTEHRLKELRWQVAAYHPGERVNLARSGFDETSYMLPNVLPAKQSWQHCLPLPNLRAGYRASTLEYSAQDLKGKFER